MREDVQRTEDKVPYHWRHSTCGRAFRTNVEQHNQKEPVIFVTAASSRPRGMPLNEEEEEGLPRPSCRSAGV